MSKDEFLDLWENRNDQLRNLGIKLVPLERLCVAAKILRRIGREFNSQPTIFLSIALK